jgi:hypothetical protein
MKVLSYLVAFTMAICGLVCIARPGASVLSQ